MDASYSFSHSALPANTELSAFLLHFLPSFSLQQQKADLCLRGEGLGKPVCCAVLCSECGGNTGSAECLLHCFGMPLSCALPFCSRGVNPLYSPACGWAVLQAQVFSDVSTPTLTICTGTIRTEHAFYFILH